MEAIRGIIANVPDWVKRLDELNGQIDQRQLELARFELSSSTSASPGRTKSIRNKGSTESLKPKGETPAHGDEKAAAAAEHEEHHNDRSPTSPTRPSAALNSASALQHQTSQVMEIAHAKARATLQKRNRRSNSLMSADAIAAANKYRTRSMIIVYYDSYVQSFFEELVKFVSASRNMMRKAKMAAKVAKIRRLADLEMPELDSKPSGGDAVGKETAADKALGTGIIEAADTSGPDPEIALPMAYTSSRQMRASARMSGRPSYPRMGGRAAAYMGSPQAPDVYDELDKGLEFIQSTCEHAAHQFLRDGECTEEIEKVKRRLSETKEIADREMERVKKEQPEILKELDEPPKTRMLRPQSMRRDPSGTKDASLPSSAVPAAIAEAARSGGPIEVGEAMQQDQAGDKPKLVYKTASMR